VFTMDLAGRILQSPQVRVQEGAARMPVRSAMMISPGPRAGGCRRGDPLDPHLVAEKSRLRRLRGLVKRGQEFIPVGNSLLRTLRRSTLGLKTRNRGPGRRLSGKDRSRWETNEHCLLCW
jgi:hypothetical protein